MPRNRVRLWTPERDAELRLIMATGEERRFGALAERLGVGLGVVKARASRLISYDARAAGAPKPPPRDKLHSKPPPDVVHTPKTRTCLMCLSRFVSTWAGERTCRVCKSTAAWRSGE